MSLKFMNGGKLKVSGPINWKNKKTGKTIQVYERKRGSKIYFTITNNGQCLKFIVEKENYNCYR